MPRTTVPVQTTNRSTGIVSAYTSVAAADGGQTAFDSTSRTGFEVNNPGTASANFTVNFGKTVDGRTVPGYPVPIAAGETRKLGPYGQNYKTTVGGVDYIQFEVSAALNVAAIKLGQADS